VDVTESSTKLLNFRRAVGEGRLKLNGADISVGLKLDNGMDYPLTGKMEFAEANVDTGTGTVGLRAQFPNPERLLLPGMYVRAVISAAVAENSFLVPQRGVAHNSKGEATALVVTPAGKVEERILITRESVGNNWVVESGVIDGDRVIVEGTQLARIGQDTTPVEVIIDEATGEIEERKEGELPMRKSTDIAKSDEGSVSGSRLKN
jgi:membrane fusion protein (multidrug efflux system)